jgi:oligosaccharyltransferase complex subunit alpha (ribophorin I)
VKVILPEGATSIKVHTPFAVDSESRALHFSTLDYLGRPVVILNKHNALGGVHDGHFQVEYTFQNQMLFIEPVYLIVFVFVLFLFAIAYSRFDMQFDEKKTGVK